LRRRPAPMDWSRYCCEDVRPRRWKSAPPAILRISDSVGPYWVPFPWPGNAHEDTCRAYRPTNAADRALNPARLNEGPPAAWNLAPIPTVIVQAVVHVPGVLATVPDAPILVGADRCAARPPRILAPLSSPVALLPSPVRSPSAVFVAASARRLKLALVAKVALPVPQVAV
jgi:hypothetical protein